jgi:hypothetical protein
MAVYGRNMLWEGKGDNNNLHLDGNIIIIIIY